MKMKLSIVYISESFSPPYPTWQWDATLDMVGLLQKLLIAAVCLLTWATKKSKES
jgi:hypothetical protein